MVGPPPDLAAAFPSRSFPAAEGSMTRLTPTRATLDQMAQATDALLWTLSHDPRVHGAYDHWRGRQRGTTRTALLHSIQENKPSDLATLHRFVREELHLTHTGLAPLLLMAFGLTLGLELSGQQDGRLAFVPDAPPQLPPGRAAKNRGGHIVRNVVWFYRAKIKYPPDTSTRIAKEHTTRNKTARVAPVVQQDRARLNSCSPRSRSTANRLFRHTANAI